MTSSWSRKIRDTSIFLFLLRFSGLGERNSASCEVNPGAYIPDDLAASSWGPAMRVQGMSTLMNHDERQYLFKQNVGEGHRDEPHPYKEDINTALKGIQIDATL